MEKLNQEKRAQENKQVLSYIYNSKSLLDNFNLKLAYCDGNKIQLYNKDEEVVCNVILSDCNDDMQLAAVISAFVQGIASSMRAK